MSLTDAACRNAKCPKARTYQRYRDEKGLYLEVTKTGAKCWRMKYRFGGKEKRLALGRYPEVTLAIARARRDNAREQLASGVDPAEAKREEKRRKLLEDETAFEKIARRWWADWSANKSERHSNYVLKRLEVDAFPKLGAKPVRELSAPDFVRLAKGIEARGAADIARRVYQSCGQVMRYAVAHGLADRNPVAEVRPGDVLRAHQQTNFARIGVEDLPNLMRQIMAYDGSVYTRLALHLMALTFVRTSELIGAKWREFDMDKAEWRIPAERTKSRRQHLVPLSRQALEVLSYLRAAHGNADKSTGAALLFPGERDRAKPMSNNTILFALYRMGYRGRMTGHGFRGLASTALNEMGYRSDVIEAQLAHVEENRVRAAYNHARYVEERRDLMQRWADYLDAVKRPGKPAKVLRMRGGREAA